MMDVESQTDLGGDNWFKGEHSEWNLHTMLQPSKKNSSRLNPFTGSKTASDVETQSPDVDVCMFCYDKFSTIYARNRHVNKRVCIAESLKSEKVIANIDCNHCKKRFKTPQALNYHLENKVCVGSKLSSLVIEGYPCSLCGICLYHIVDDLSTDMEEYVDNENENENEYFNSTNVNSVLNRMMLKHCISGECLTLTNIMKLAKHNQTNILWSQCYRECTPDARIPQIFEWMRYSKSEYKDGFDRMVLMIKMERTTQKLRNKIDNPNKKNKIIFLNMLLKYFPVLPDPPVLC